MILSVNIVFCFYERALIVINNDNNILEIKYLFIILLEKEVSVLCHFFQITTFSLNVFFFALFTFLCFIFNASCRFVYCF